MHRITLLFAALLIALGILGYVGTPRNAAPAASNSDADSTTPSENEESAKSKRSITALIPAFTGGLLLIFGLLSFNTKWRVHAMHGAVLIGLLGFLAAGGRGASGLMKLLAGGADVNVRSLVFVCIMAVLCGVYVMLCVRSFVQARRRRRAESA